MNLVHVKNPKRKISLPKRKISLRQCLLGIGVTDEEMRFRKGARNILTGWIGDEKRELLELARNKWKENVLIHHEANGGDPEQWKNLNTLWNKINNSITKKLLKRRKKSKPIWMYECEFCSTLVEKPIHGGYTFSSISCKSPACQTALRRRQTFRRTLRNRVYRRKICKSCNNEFMTCDSKRVYCKTECRKKAFRAYNRKKSAEYRKKRPWKVIVANLTPEQKEHRRQLTNAARKRRIANMTEDERKAYTAKMSLATRMSRQKKKALTSSQKPVNF